jgi:hypothetical protein
MLSPGMMSGSPEGMTLSCYPKNENAIPEKSKRNPFPDKNPPLCTFPGYCVLA